MSMKQTQAQQVKHTPGPWRYCMYADHIPNFILKFGTRPLAKINYFAGNPEFAVSNDIIEGEANARLIAAAPELLAALEMCEHRLSLGENPDDDEAINKARSAIAKARG
jgi:hypothetical protein